MSDNRALDSPWETHHVPGELIMSVVQSQTTRSCNFHNHDRSDSLRRREVICLILEIYSNLNRAETAENLGRLSQNSIALFNLSIEKSLQFHNIKFRSLRNASCILELKNTRDPTLYISIESRLNVAAYQMLTALWELRNHTSQ